MAESVDDEDADHDRLTSQNDIFVETTRRRWPIVYSTNYDIHHWLTFFHPFDTKKWGRY